MRTARSFTAAAAAALALAAAGCGGDDEGGSGATGGTGGSTGASAAEQTFAQTCGGCHTLGAAGTEGQVGPNLDELGADKETVLEAIERGPGVMPEALLEGAEADAVAQYVADNAGG